MFNEAQLAQLSAPLDAKRIKERSEGGKTFSYLDTEGVIRTANTIFGFGMWSSQVLELRQTSQQYMGVSYPNNKRTARLLADLADLRDNEKIAYTVGWLAVVQVTVRAEYEHGSMYEATYTDTGHGDGTNMPSLPGANEFASKEAASDAVKRCLRFLGDQFGLTLWDKTQAHVGEGPADEETRKSYLRSMGSLGLDNDAAKLAVAGVWESATSEDLRDAFAAVRAASQKVEKPAKEPEAKTEPEKEPEQEQRRIIDDAVQATAERAADKEKRAKKEEQNESEAEEYVDRQALLDLAGLAKQKGQDIRELVVAEAKEHGNKVRKSWFDNMSAELRSVPDAEE